MRYFLIDRITEFTPGKTARGLKNVTLSDDILNDHFPDFPIMPGALILESVSQLSGFLLEMSLNQPGQPLQRALLVQVLNAKFYETSGPGDQLDIMVKLESTRESAARVSAVIECVGKRIARAELTFVLRQIDSERIHEQRRYLYKIWTRGLNPPPAIL